MGPLFENGTNPFFVNLIGEARLIDTSKSGPEQGIAQICRKQNVGIENGNWALQS